MLSKGSVDLYQTDSSRKTTLHWAALRGDSASLELLLLAGASPSTKDDEDDTLLHAAAVSTSKTCIELLLMADAEAGAKNNYSDLPLHTACRHHDEIGFI